jgi:hypothetical protein
MDYVLYSGILTYSLAQLNVIYEMGSEWDLRLILLDKWVAEWQAIPRYKM